MNNNKKFFGICIKQCEIINRLSNKSELLRHGDLIRILELGCQKTDKIIIKLYNSDDNSFETKLLECAKQNVDYVVEALWLHLIGTNENSTRIRIYNDRELVLRLKCDTEIIIKSYENDSNANIMGVIQLIGSVEKVGFGHFIGVKLQKPPVNRDTYITLYKKQFNQATSLLLFRIDELLDTLKDAEQHKLRQNRNENNNYTSPLAKITSGSNTNALCGISPLSSSTVSNTTQSNLYDFCKPNNLHSSSTNKQNQNHYDLNIPSHSTDRWMALNHNGSEKEEVINMEYQNLLSTAIKRSEGAVSNEKTICERLENVNTNEKGTISKRNKSVDVDIKFTNASTAQANQFCCKKPLFCNICHDLVDHKAMILSCKHIFCLKCLRPKNIVRCPFTSRGVKDNSCQYQLKPFELTQLREKLGELITTDNRPQTIKRDEGLILLCKNKKCYNFLFTRISEPQSENLFKCSKCEAVTCVNCNAIHDFMTCAEYSLVLIKPQQIPHQTGGDDNEIFMNCIDNKCNGQWFILKKERSPIFKCPICQMYNCIKCKTIHQNQTCEQYQKTL